MHGLDASVAWRRKDICLCDSDGPNGRRELLERRPPTRRAAAAKDEWQNTTQYGHVSSQAWEAGLWRASKAGNTILPKNDHRFLGCFFLDLIGTATSVIFAMYFLILLKTLMENEIPAVNQLCTITDIVFFLNRHGREIPFLFITQQTHDQQQNDDNPAHNHRQATTQQSTITPHHTTSCTGTQHKHRTTQAHHTTSTSTSRSTSPSPVQVQAHFIPSGTRLAHEYRDTFFLSGASNSPNHDCAKVQGKSGLLRTKR